MRHAKSVCNNEAASRWHRNAQKPKEIPDSPDIQVAGNGHRQSRKVATTRLHPNLSNSRSSLHTSTKMHGKIHKKPRSIHAASAGRLMSWLQGESRTKTTDKVHHDRNEAGMQHSTSGTASCKLACSDHSRHTQNPGSIQACFANAAPKQNAAKQQLAPENAVSTETPTVL